MAQHEILAALAGYPGAHVEVPSDSAGAVWRLRGALQVDASAKVLAESLLPLGAHCGALRRFVREWSRAAEWCGLYDPDECEGDAVQLCTRSVFAHAVTDALSQSLSEYEQVIEGLWEEAASGHLSLSKVAADLSEWRYVLPTLTELSGSLGPCQSTGRLLTKLQSAVSSSHGAARRHVVRVAQLTNEVLLRQLADWTALGELPAGNTTGFFILPPESGPAADFAPDKAIDMMDRKSQPAHITEKATQLGLSAGMLTRMLSAKSSGELPPDCAIVRECILSREALQDGTISSDGLENQLSMAQETRALRLASRVCDPSRGGGWRLPDYLRAIGDYFLCFRGDLWRSFSQRSAAVTADMVRAALPPEYGAAGAPMLGRDDLRLLVRKANAQRTSAFALCLEQHRMRDSVCGEKVLFVGGAAEDAAGERLFGCIQNAERRLKEASWDRQQRLSEFARLFLDTTSGLALDLVVEHPLTDIITKQCVERLRKVFKNCMHLTHTETVLTDASRHLAVAERMAHLHSRADGKLFGARARTVAVDARVRLGRKMVRRLLLVRRRMSFFFDNLKFFVMTDVLHTQFAQLEADVCDGRGYDRIKGRVLHGLRQMTEEAFLDQGAASENRLVREGIANAIKCSLELWALVTTALGELHSKEQFASAMLLLSKYFDAATRIAERFDAYAAELYKLLSRHGQSRKYNALLVRLDFNRFFSGKLAPAVEEQAMAARLRSVRDKGAH
eukprot:TRINITY_DN9217_c0_g2_i1.p1 TRINITY_DN9217_c0_g2~~TRINITY_DN9217_c0_g2_i1.p1  ORF type:complete len:733 (+),score=260.41 TRINITY_DN9217_c0_g2_i1:49-2247(+)